MFEDLDEAKKRLEIDNLHVERRHAPWKLIASVMTPVVGLMTMLLAALSLYYVSLQQLKMIALEQEERRKFDVITVLIQVSKEENINQKRSLINKAKDHWPNDPAIVRCTEETEDNAYRHFVVTLSRLSSRTMGLTRGGSGGAAFVRIQLPASMLFGANEADLTPSATGLLMKLKNAMDHDVGSAHITIIGGARGSVSGYNRLSRVRDQAIARKFLALGVPDSQITAGVLDDQPPLVGKSGSKLDFRAERFEFVISGTLETNIHAINAVPIDGLDRDDAALQVDNLGIQQNIASGVVSLSRTIRTVLIPLSPQSDLAVTTQNPSAAGLLAATHYVPRTLSPSAKPSSLLPPTHY